MGQVTVSVNDRTYTVGCGDGEEDHVRDLARFIDRQVSDLVKEVGQVGDARLLLMAALLIADDLSEALARNNGSAPAARKTADADESAEEEAAEALEKAAAHAEALAEALEA